MKRLLVLAVLLVAGPGCGVKDFTPQGELPDAPETFRWPATKAASAYLVQIFAPDGTVLFESPRLQRAELAPDEELRARLRAAGRFEWRVRIYDGDRIAGHSDRWSVRLAGGA